MGIAGTRHLRRLRIHVRSRYRVRTIQGIAGYQATSAGEQGAWGGDQEVAWCSAEDEGALKEMFAELDGLGIA